MEYKNNEQNSVIFSIAEILSKMSNQVGFLIRNNKLMSQLDVDMLMDNTRKLYDTICSVRCNMDIDSIPMEVENEEELGIRNEELGIEEELGMRSEELGIEEELETEEELESEEMGDDSESQSVVDSPVVQTPVDSGIVAYRKLSDGTHQTIGDVLENTEDKSLAARLQRKPIADLTTSVGINDKFLLLNELFGGSMEKYNKCIRALNNFSTLLGAKTYMEEMQVEFQWDCQSDAYKKLDDLVERRFI